MHDDKRKSKTEHSAHVYVLDEGELSAAWALARVC